MLCQNCNNVDASVRIKTIIKGRMCEIALCRICASELGYVDDIILDDLFQDFPESSLKTLSNRVMRCDKCGLSFEDIMKNANVGCAKCYETFYDKLVPVINKIHGTKGDI
ncbi:MAG TPA: hypothetical protein GXZ23_03850 [Clostridiales bacterium]|jgi:protein arginine kinase activator|nr:hypothetical protein [Clostridiales bacterium]